MGLIDDRETVDNDTTQQMHSKTASSRIVIKKDKHPTPSKGASGSDEHVDVNELDLAEAEIGISEVYGARNCRI